MKSLSVFALLLFASTAHAGLTSLVAGYAAGKVSSSQEKQAHPVLITSDSHDVIACRSYETSRGQCSYCEGTKSCLPAVFAGQAGYKTLHKTSSLISGSELWIIMEVSK